jgi:formate-dependent nitrite reductase cytochrome c552 subunit
MLLEYIHGEPVGKLLCDKYNLDGLIEHFPSAEPELEEFEWCTDCKEYDQTAHCCHRAQKVIQQVVEELKAERKMGEWLEHYSHEDGERDGVYCSECHEHYYFGGSLMKYCPNCGSYNGGDEDE